MASSMPASTRSTIDGADREVAWASEAVVSPETTRQAQVYAVMAQWYEVTWGNVINTREEIHALLGRHGLRVVDETSLSRFYIVTGEKGPTIED